MVDRSEKQIMNPDGKNLLGGEEAAERKNLGEKGFEANWDLDLLLETILDCSGDIILISNRTGDSVIYNDGYAQLVRDAFGIEMKPGLLAHTQFLEPEHIDFWRQVHRRALSGESFHVEFVHKFLSGEIRRFDVSVSPIIKNGEVIGFAEFFKEITESRKTEVALQNSRQKFRSLFENLPDGFIAVDRSGIIREYNPSFRDMLGYSEEELRGVYYENITPEEWQPLQKEIILNQVLVRGYSDYFQKEYIRKDGRVIPVELRVFQSRDHEGRGDGFWALARDITKRKNYEDALRKSEEKYRILVNHAPAGIYEIDFQARRLISVNDVMCEYTGYSRKEFLELDPLILLTPESRDMFLARLGKMIGGEDVPQTVDYTVVGKNGRRFEVMLNVRLNYDDGVLKTGTVVAHNITDLKEAKKEKELLEAQLRQSQKMEAVGVLASGVAHDFNNILQAVSGNVQFMHSLEGVGEQAHKYLTSIENAVERAADLVRSLLTFGRKVEPELAPLDLRKELGLAVEMLSRIIPKMVAVNLETALDPLWIKADANQFHQILMNLGANARDAMPNGGQLLFQAENVTLDEEFCKTEVGLTPGKYVRLVISDTGQGMDETTQKNIFTPFYTTKETGKGAGLGLAIVYGIVKNHGASISCSSRPGYGTVFTMYWPAEAPADVVAESPDYLPDLKAGGDEIILVVDDEPDILDVAAEFLDGVGYSVVKAGSGEEALDVFKEKKSEIDLVLLDLGMPGIGGYNALVEMLSVNPRVKIVIASGYSGEKLALEAMAAGAAGFLPKPYRLQDLLKKIREALDNKDS